VTVGSATDRTDVGEAAPVVARERGADALYLQVADWILAHIRDRRLGPGDLLPSQNDLMRRLGVSQATVRHAIHRLTKDGAIVARQGKGLFVAEPRVSARIDSLGAVSSEAGGPSAFAVEPVETALVRPSPTTLAALGLPPGSQVARVRRRLLRAGQVVGMESRNLRVEHLGLVAAAALRGGDLADALAADAATAVARVECRLRAAAATDFDARLLGIERDALVLHQFMVFRTTDGAPVMAGRTTYLADRVDVRFDVHPQPAR